MRLLQQNKLYYVTLRSGPTDSSKLAAHLWSVGDTDGLCGEQGRWIANFVGAYVCSTHDSLLLTGTT